jgi:Secretion system C-terminal sorting domain
MKKVLFLIALFFAALAVQAQEVVAVPGEITANTTWTKDKIYRMNNFTYVKNDATLTIEAGTKVQGLKGSKATLIITRGAKLIANGTASEPIVFTSSDATTPTYGDWGGVYLLGKAPVNLSAGGVVGQGIAEGGINNALGDGLYGGNDPNDNSGSLRYVRIEYCGIALSTATNSEINGLTMSGVGAGTTIEYVQVSYCGDDSFEWFGGTVNCKYLIAYRGLDDDFDADNGYSGNVQFAVSIRDPRVADGSQSNGFEIDNNQPGDNLTPKTKPTFSNVTIIGPSGTTIDANYGRAAHLRRNCEAGIFNSVFIGSYPRGIVVEGANTAENARTGLLEIKNCHVAGPTRLLDSVAIAPGGSGTALAINTWYRTPAFANQIAPMSSAAALQDPFNLAKPNPRPTFASPLLGAAAFTAPRVAGAFFQKVNYMGAFGPNEVADWTRGWAFFGALNTDGLTNTQDADKYIANVQMVPTVANDFTNLQMTLVEAADVNVELFGMNGQSFGTQISEKAAAGDHVYTLKVADLQSGFYFVRIQAGAAVKTEKLIVVK